MQLPKAPVNKARDGDTRHQWKSQIQDVGEQPAGRRTPNRGLTTIARPTAAEHKSSYAFKTIKPDTSGRR